MDLECPSKPIPLEKIDLPAKIREELKLRGYSTLTPPQAEAVARGVLSGKSMVVSAPTASGKTLIAEMALMRASMGGGIAIYTCPLKALANEKFDEFSGWSRRLGLRLGISTGDFDEPGESLSRYDVLITTYERLDSIFRHRPSWIERVSLIVIDEIHSVGDPDRGPIIEMIVARALRLGIQVLGLSATIGNPDELAEWLRGEAVICDWRPVPLIYGYYDRRGSRFVFEDGRVERVVGDPYIYSSRVAIERDYQVLIFSQSRRNAESLARRIAESLGLYAHSISGGLARDLVSDLESSVSSRIEVDNLKPLVSRGVAFHHAGLSLEARRIIERGFREGLLKVVVSTPTLAAGVNLPARRVLITTMRYSDGYYEPISLIEFKQMAGRAGRPQFDEYGEAIIVDQTPSKAIEYIRGSPEPVDSMLNSERSLRIHVLSILASGYAKTFSEVEDFFSDTFYGFKRSFRGLRSVLSRVINDLSRMEMIDRRNSTIEVTRLGRVVSMQYIDPLTAHRALTYLRGEERVKGDLWYLHMICQTPDFIRSGSRRGGFKKLEDEAIELAEAGELPEPLGDVDFELWLLAYRNAKALKLWIDEYDEDSIYEITGLMPGDLRSMIETATWIAHAIHVVSSIFKDLRHHSEYLYKLSIRLEEGVREDLLELIKLKGIGRVRARALYDAGYRSIDDLRRADPRAILRLRGFNRRVVKELFAQLGVDVRDL